VGVVVPSLPMKLLTVVHPASFAVASDGGTTAGCWFSTVVGGCVLGLAAGVAGVVEPQAIMELASRSASPMQISRRAENAELIADSYNVFLLPILTA